MHEENDSLRLQTLLQCFPPWPSPITIPVCPSHNIPSPARPSAPSAVHRALLVLDFVRPVQSLHPAHSALNPVPAHHPALAVQLVPELTLADVREVVSASGLIESLERPPPHQLAHFLPVHPLFHRPSQPAPWPGPRFSPCQPTKSHHAAQF
ncbi:hypothetical protein M427DRAFT_64941 [Gonapodya prolifera JEL478]|uniref:Uncharacterized protein n=1 Tax=Gonapodya prolifera (strain JEL478) TaxID=1344416 RepID=A0A138ZXH3_GONPJ|nr:hypothetical protein M427DRAFT_64941 [Gonapodya prolifera JEL478]|eukprot:KXS08995.1 hypothetical protein M427DRAFT_64941 [Gonapodya prolifera JEL478]